MGTPWRAGTCSGMPWTCVGDVLDVLLAGGGLEHGNLGGFLPVFTTLHSPTKCKAPEQGLNPRCGLWVEHRVCMYVYMPRCI